MVTNSFFQKMRDGTEISVNQWSPKGEVKAIIVISHGMAEHSVRYDKAATYFAEQGYFVSAHDHRGHGKTALKQKENGQVGLGYVADKNGFEQIRDDIFEIVDSLKKQFPGKKVILLGHSFGSLISQSVIEKDGASENPQIDYCILSGSRGPQQALVGAGLVVSDLLYLFGQKKRPSKFMDKMAFGAYNNKIPNNRTDFDWLTKDNSIVDKYIADEFCGVIMTTEFYHEMFRLLLSIHNKKNMKKIRKDLPVLIAAGKDDPVGDYGKTVTDLYNIYKANQMSDVELKLYENDRHEILNETDCETVQKDFMDWINKRV